MAVASLFGPATRRFRLPVTLFTPLDPSAEPVPDDFRFRVLGATPPDSPAAQARARRRRASVHRRRRGGGERDKGLAAIEAFHLVRDTTLIEAAIRTFKSVLPAR
jgi:hypothetical protein